MLVGSADAHLGTSSCVRVKLEHAGRLADNSFCRSSMAFSFLSHHFIWLFHSKRCLPQEGTDLHLLAGGGKAASRQLDFQHSNNMRIGIIVTNSCCYAQMGDTQVSSSDHRRLCASFAICSVPS